MNVYLPRYCPFHQYLDYRQDISAVVQRAIELANEVDTVSNVHTHMHMHMHAWTCRWQGAYFTAFSQVGFHDSVYKKPNQVMDTHSACHPHLDILQMWNNPVCATF